MSTMSRRCIPYTPNRRPLAETTIALVTTAGVHGRNQPAFNPEGEKEFRVIPGDIAAAELMISHPYYDHTDADRDINCVFPLDRLHELAQEGCIGRAAPRHFGFMGYNPDPTRLVRETAVEIVEHLRRDGTELVVITPG